MSFNYPDKYDKTVIIPAIVEGGKLKYFYGGRLPEFPEGTMIDLTVPVYAIKDEAFLKKLEAGDDIEVLPKGKTIYAAAKSRLIPGLLSGFTVSLTSLISGRVALIDKNRFYEMSFVEVILNEPLRIQMRGTKLGRLRQVKCFIPSLNKPSVSLNHAYHIISETFEPERISHSGSAFEMMLFVNDEDKVCQLDYLRGNLNNQYEKNILIPKAKKPKK